MFEDEDMDAPEDLLFEYANATGKYEKYMQIAKTSKSQKKRLDAGYSAQVAYEEMKEIKMMLNGMGIKIERNF